ncbi:MAG TPA: ATP-binding cassette domain-containing protein [Anaerolineales bacterium]|nr:ATP-binding cassette domain-containing protein [Anaerolineales bacterium]
MATIKLQNVNFSYSTPPISEPPVRLFEIKRERIQEDLPVHNSRGVIALDNVNLTILNGQIFVVVGPSGCGKSTLLRVVAGIERNYTGEVLYDGEDIRSIPPGDRYIGMIFQNFALYPNFSNEGNLSFFFKNHKITDEETKERIRYTSELMGIGFNELLPRRPGTLSGGEKQRVAIARAIVRAPKLFLFDEPLSNLDAKLRVQTRTEIKRLLHRFGITSLYVTHDQTEAAALADQIVVMHAGRIEQVGTYQQLTENPASLFVAGFFGLPPMDLFPSGLICGGQLFVEDHVFPVPHRTLSLVQEGQPVTMGVRRETVQIAREAHSPNATSLRPEVEALEIDLVHRQQVVFLRLGQFAFSGLCSIDIKLHVGQRLTVQLDPERLYFFDTLSGKRL